MILPTKRLPPDRALISVGANVLLLLDAPMTVSKLWDVTRRSHAARPGASLLTYDWFVLALDLLFALRAIDFDGARIRRFVP